MEKHYNLDYLNSISGEDQDFIMDMILTFVSDTPGELEKLNALISDNKWRAVGEAAHKFSSSLVLLGLENLKNIAYQIEVSGLQMKQIEDVPDLMAVLEKGCIEIIGELKRDFNV